MSVPKKKRTDLSVSEKVRLINKYDELNLSSLSQREAASQLGVPQSSLSKLLKSRHVLNINGTSENRKRKREGKNQAVDEALLLWFRQVRSMNSPINRSILSQKAIDFGRKLNVCFKATDGWLTRWKSRHSIIYKKLHRAKPDSDSSAAVNWLKTTWLNVLNTYESDDIFNTSETELFYQATPEHCVVFQNLSTEKRRIKNNKITILFTCNMTGSVKLKPLVVGRIKSFNGVKNLPVEYANNINGWMTAAIFEDYLRNWDAKLGENMKKIALILDYCPAQSNLTLRNIELVFLPPNTTSMIQPLDHGIIKTFKILYRSDMRRRILQYTDETPPLPETSFDVVKNISILDALHMTMNAWSKVPDWCIKNCFKQSGLTRAWDECVQVPDFDLISEQAANEEEMKAWVNVDRALQVSATFTDEEIVQLVENNHQTKSADDEENEKADDDPERIPVSKKQTLEAVGILRRALEEGGADDSDYKLLYSIENIFHKLYKRL